MDWNKIGESILIFIKNIPNTLKKTSIWLLISYLIPIINVAIIWGMKGKNFKLDLNIISIIIVTNACFVTSLVYLSDKKREISKILNISTLVITVVLFALSIVEIEQKKQIFPLNIYKIGAFLTLGLSILFGLISKYDEVEAESRVRAEKAKGTTETKIGGKSIKL